MIFFVLFHSRLFLILSCSHHSRCHRAAFIRVLMHATFIFYFNNIGFCLISQTEKVAAHFAAQEEIRQAERDARQPPKEPIIDSLSSLSTSNPNATTNTPCADANQRLCLAIKFLFSP